jgi:hypothetical protein
MACPYMYGWPLLLRGGQASTAYCLLIFVRAGRRARRCAEALQLEHVRARHGVPLHVWLATALARQAGVYCLLTFARAVISTVWPFIGNLTAPVQLPSGQ